MSRTILFAALAAAVVGALPLSAAAKKQPPAAGAIVFTSTRANGDRELYVVSGDGSGLRRLTFNSLFERQAAWSPDRSRIAFSAADPGGNFDIYVVDADGSGQTRLTSDPARDDSPQWTPDGQILFQRDTRAWTMNADGSGAAELPTGPGDALTPTASPNGRLIAFASNRGAGTGDAIYVLKETGKVKQVTFPAAGQDVQPRFSPDGRLISFVRDSGTPDNDVYVVDKDGQNLRRLTNTPDRLEFWTSWSGDNVVFSARDASFNWHLYSVPSSGGPDTSVPTAPRAPYVDSFDQGVDTGFWYVLQDPGSSISVSNGALVASIAGTAVPGPPWNQVAAQIGSPCHVPGDFDMQVDYRLLTWPAFGGYFASLAAIFGDVSVARQSGPWNPPYNQQYSGWSQTPAGFQSNAVNTLDTSGSLRIQRIGAKVYSYVRGTGEPWQLIFQADGSTGEGVPQFGLSAQADQFGHQDGSVAYDNFRLNSGAVTCPSWWQDFAPDAG
jgi:hypothetical protein